MSNRDLGIRGRGAGKGDHDRTSDVGKFKKNLKKINFNPDDKTGFEKVGYGRFRKTYGKTEKESAKAPQDPGKTPEDLMQLARSSRSFISGTPSDH